MHHETSKQQGAGQQSKFIYRIRSSCKKLQIVLPVCTGHYFRAFTEYGRNTSPVSMTSLRRYEVEIYTVQENQTI
jgi:hypothetical protein